MRQIFSGAALLVAALALAAVAQANKPVDSTRAVYPPGPGSGETRFGPVIPASGLSHTAYDVLRVSIWALLIFGALLIIVGLMKYRAQLRR
jgi:hypothetical protein